VLSPDEAVLEVAAGRGARAITEEEPPLAAAIRQAEDEARGRGADALAVVLPDTPLVTAGALTRALHTLGPVVLAPSVDERGTNLLLRRPPRAIDARFGPDSYRRHLEASAEADLPIAVVGGIELAFDLDAPNDILTVLEAPGTTRTKAVLRDLRIDERMRARVGAT
jgi:2-phospho-L-lactate guanylyltransferase